MSDMAGTRPYIASTNPSPRRSPAYPQTWLLYIRETGTVRLTVVKDAGQKPQVRLTRAPQLRPA